MQQTYMSTRGLTSANNIVQVDGLMINGLDGDGAVQQYVNNATIQEMTYQTAGAGADVSPGGVRVNMIPQDGGNEFRGSFVGVYNPGQWQSDNSSDSLRARGLRAVDKIEHIYDINPAIGGPIKRDKLWFFASARFWGVNAPIADTFYVPTGATQADCQSGRVACEQGIDDQQDQECDGPADVAGDAAQQAVGVLRRDRQGPRPWDERGRRSAHGVAGLDVADLQRRLAEGDQHDQQQAAARERLLVQRRRVRDPEPAGREQGAGHAGVRCPDPLVT